MGITVFVLALLALFSAFYISILAVRSWTQSELLRQALSLLVGCRCQSQFPQMPVRPQVIKSWLRLLGGRESP